MQRRKEVKKPMIQEDQNSESSTEEIEDEALDTDLADEAGEEQGDESSKANKRSVQARIDELSGKLKESEERVKELETKVTEKVPMPPAVAQDTSPEAQKIINQLESLGFTRKEALEEKIKTIESQIELNSEHNRLRGEYDGSDGRPQYDKAKVERYMRDRAIFDPEVAYKAMHEAELLDWHLKKTEAGSKKRPYIEKPGGAGVARTSDNQITREKIQEVVDNPTPANRAWYEKNRNTIRSMMANGQL